MGSATAADWVVYELHRAGGELLCRLVLWFDYATQTDARTKSRGEYLGPCVLLQCRLVGALGRPWFGR